MELAVRRRLSRARWALDRFGLTPRKLVRRVRNRAEPRVLCLTLPKSGTNLLQRVVCLHPRLYRKLGPTLYVSSSRRWKGMWQLLGGLRPGQVLFAHLAYEEPRARAIRRRGVRCIFMIRDPRDVVVSLAYYVAAKRRHSWNAAYRAARDVKGRIRVAIEGADGHASIADTLGRLAGWVESGTCLVVRFEDLVGPEGGGDEATQMKTIRSIYDHLGLEVDEVWLRGLRSQLFSDSSPTFRRGAIGGWRDHFDDETKALFKKEAGELLVRFGYERGDDW